MEEMSGSRSVSPTEVDFSVIRTSIDMGHSMIDQILNGIHYGSDEIRAMLREECDFILECKVCRNMFRSFANFVAHKRVYCKESIVEFREMGSVSNAETETIVVQPQPPEESPESSLSMIKDGGKAELEQGQKKANADSVIDQVVKKTYKGNSKEYQFYTKAAEKMVHAKAGKITNTVTLKTIPATTKAMIVNFNHMGSDTSNVNDTDIISEHLCANASSKDTASSNMANVQKKKSSLTDVCSNLLHKQSANRKDTVNDKGAAPALLATLSDRQRKSVPQKLSSNIPNTSSIISGVGNKTAPLDVDDDDVAEWSNSSKQSHSNKQNSPKNTRSPEKMETSPVTEESDKPWIKLCNLEKLLCLECGRKFKYGDSLKQHAKIIHCGMRTVSRCPLCQKEFSYFNSVARHIRNVHKKSENQIQEFRKKVNARSKCVERISPENLAKMMSTSSGSSLSNSSGHKQCKKCQKYFSNKKRFRQHTSKCNAKVTTTNKLPNHQQAKKLETNNDVTNIKEVQSTKEPEHVYKEKELDKPSALYKALTSPISGKPPTVVYVYPKSPIQQNDSLKAKMSKKAIDKITSSACKEKQKDDSYKDKVNDKTPLPDTVVQLQHKRESRSGSNESGKDKQGLRSSSNETLTDKSVSNVREIRETRSSTNDPSHKRESRSSSNEHKKELCSSIELEKEKRELRNASIEPTSCRESPAKTRAAHVKQDDLKIQVELKKLKERLMIEAIGKSPIKSDNIDDASVETKQRRALDEVGCETDQRTKLKISIRQESEKNEEKSQDRINSDTLRSSNSSPVLKSPTSPNSCPISPSSLNSNSADGYSHKFKMTAKEMADLVVTASLTKFAKERKKRAHEILNKKNSKEGLGAMLTQPMKRSIRGSQIIPKKMYSTRLTSGSRLTGTSSNVMVGRRQDERAVSLMEQRLLDHARPESLDKTVGELHGKDKMFDLKSKRLSRELRQLENTAGFNEKRYYSSHTGSDTSKEEDSQTNPAKEIAENQSRDISQVTAVNVLMQKLMAAQESVNNSKNIMDKNSPVKEHNSGIVDESSDTSEGTKGPSRLSRLSAHEESRKTAVSVSSAADVNKDMKKKVINSRSSSAGSEPITIEGDSGHRSRSAQSNIAMDSVTTSSRDSSSERLGSSQSRRLSRQLKMLENTVGFNEKGYYDTHSDSSLSNDPKSKESSQIYRPAKLEDTVKDLSTQNSAATPTSVRDDKTRNNVTKISTAADQKESTDVQDNTRSPVRISILKTADGTFSRTILSSGSITNESDMINNRELGDDLEGKGKRIFVTKGTDKSKVKNVGVGSGNQSEAADGKKPVVTNSDITLDENVAGKTRSDIALDQNIKGTADVRCMKDVEERKVTGNTSRGVSSIDEGENSGKVTGYKPKDIDIYENDGGSTSSPTPHRTRLSTGSLVFDPELLKTNPSKQDTADKKADGNKTENTGIRHRSSLSPKKRLPLSPEKMVQQSIKSEPEKFSLLATGIIQCEECKRHFWKVRSYRSHFKGRCKKAGVEKSKEMLEVRKKRPLSFSPRKVGGAMSDDEHDRIRKDCKKPRLIGMSPTKERRIRSEDQPIDNVARRQSRFTDGETSPTKQSKQKSKEEMKQEELQSSPLQNRKFVKGMNIFAINSNSKLTKSANSRIIVQSACRAAQTREIDLGNKTGMNFGITDEAAGTSESFVNDSDGDSEFSGFSETDLTEQEQNIEGDFQCDKKGVKNNMEGDIDDDLDNIEDVDIDDGHEIKDTDTVKTVCGDDFVKKGRLRRKQNVDRWAKKRSYSTPFRSFVCDTKRPRKMVCQATKNIDKMIDTESLVCKYCDSKHSNVSNLRQHAIRHLGWMRYKCKMCLYTGYNLSEVKLHLSRSHAIKSSSLEMSSYVIDLKTEARNIRISKRSKTLREHRAKGITSQSSSDIYAKPRPNIAATTTKAGRIIVKREAGSDVASASKNRVENNNQTTKSNMDATVLNKARLRLSNVLNP